MASLAFLQPLYLFALLAVAVPIIIHLISRRNALRWKFAAMEFLLRSHRRVERRLRIKQLLLLLLRCLLFMAIAAAFARPFFRRAQGSNPSKARAILMIVDDSMSMSYQPNFPKSTKETLFQQARQKALELLKQLRGEDQIALLRGSAAPQKADPLEQTELTYDKNIAIEKLKKWTPSYRTTDLLSAMRRAAVIADKVKGLQPTIVILSDFARHAFESTKAPMMASLPPVELIPIRPPAAPENRAVIRLTTEPAPFASDDAYRFSVTIQNFSNKTVRDLPIEIKIGNQPKARGFVQLAAGATAEKSFVIRLPRAGVYTGSVEIGNDALPQDNRYYFALQARQRPRLLLVNGDPRTIPYLDELFYVERALQEVSSPFFIDTVHASTKLPSPSKYQAIFIVNAAQLPTPWTVELRKFVNNGGGLFLAMGNQVSPNEYNQQFDGLLPRQLRHIALAAQRPDGTGIAIQRYFGEVSASHPIFHRLYEDGLTFQSARVSKLMLVETRQRREAGTILWRFSHGPPALLERRVGRGRVLLLTTTLDRDWSDLCIRTFFQPWLKRVASYLAGGSRFQQSKSLMIGQIVPLKLPKAFVASSLMLQLPNNKEQVLRASDRGFQFPGGHLPGIYRFTREGKTLSILPKIVNIDPTESDLTPLTNKQLQPIGSLTRNISNLASQQSERLWPFLFLFLLALFLSEAAILRWM